MEKRVIIKYVRMSEKKLRILASNYTGKRVDEATAIMQLANSKGAKLLKKAVESCAALFTKDEAPHLMIKGLIIDKGPRFKRWRPGGRGVAKRYERKSAHIQVVLQHNGK